MNGLRISRTIYKPQAPALVQVNAGHPIHRAERAVIVAGSGGATDLSILGPFARVAPTLVNSPAWVQTRGGLALQTVAASSQYVRIYNADSPGQNVTGQRITLSILVRPDDLSAAQDFGGVWSATNSQKQFKICTLAGTLANASARMATDNSGGNATVTDSGITLVAGTWYVLTARWSDGDQTIRISVNRRNASNFTSIFTNINNPGAVANGAGFSIGADVDGSLPATATFGGARLWSRFLSDAEIASLSDDFWLGFRSYEPKKWAIQGTVAQTITPAAPAIASQQAWFTPKLNLKVSPGTIGTHAAWPTPKLNLSIDGATIGTQRAWFTPSLTSNVTISDATIPTQAAWFDPVVAGPLSGATIPSQQAWYSPSLNSDVTLLPALLGPRRFWFTPIVAGPISNAGIATHAAWFSPLVYNNLTIEPAAPIAGPRAIPSPTVGFITVIHVGAPFAGPRTIPSPTVSGGPQYISVYGIPSQRAWPITTLDGGLLACRLYISGVEVTSYLSWDPGHTANVQSQTLGRWRADFYLQVAGGVAQYRPRVGQTVLIVDRGYRLFMGCLTEVVVDRYLSTETLTVMKCTATDKSGICDHRRVTGTTYAAGSDVVSTILDICENFLNGEGILTTSLPAVGSLGTLSRDITFNFSSVTQAFDSIATDAGLVWWIDDFGALQFSALLDLPAAPFNLTETSGNWRNAGGNNGMSVKETLSDYFNKIYAVSNLNILPGAGSGGGSSTGGSVGKTETFDFHPDNPGVITITNSLGVRVAVGIQCSNPIGSVSLLTVNGIVQTTVDFGAYAGQVPSPPDLLWLWGGPATGNPSNQIEPDALPADHAAIVIEYTPYIATSSSAAQYGTALNPLNPSGHPLGTCGSGIFEGVVQVHDVSSQADLDAIALATLNRIKSPPVIVEYETDYPGLKPGQKQNINVPLSGIENTDMLITSVSGVFIPPGDLGHGGSFRWTVEARSNLDPGNWQKWYERLLARSDNALPVPQYEEATFVLGAGSTLSSGVNITNPYIVGRTGKVLELLAACSTGPVNQDLLLTVEANGFLLVGQIRIPAGTASNVLIVEEISASVTRYLFARDVLNVTASYQAVSGGTPVKASGVTLKARWTM